MFKREHFLQQIEQQFRIHSVCALLGPRQVGKTTLARAFAKEKRDNQIRAFDLENALDLKRLENPMLALSSEPEKLIIIDEIQMRPDLFPAIRVLVDDPSHKRNLLVLGSASRDLLRQSSETLAGRIGYIELPPLSLTETGDLNTLWLRGGFPRSYLADNESDSFLWRQNYITTFLERDIPNLGFNLPAKQLLRFWMMLTYYHGQTLNTSEIARSLGVSDPTVRRYLDILIGTFMIRELIPWSENIKKRQVRSPKIYFRDSGILHALLNIRNTSDLDIFPRLGAFWEGFALEEIIKFLGLRSEECFFWATHADAELDLFIMLHGKRIGFEFKYADVPKTTKSMRIALTDLRLDHIFVIYPGTEIFPLDEKITAYGLKSISKFFNYMT